MQLLGRKIGLTEPLFLIAGPCVIESAGQTLEIAATLRELAARLGVMLIFKASFEKANRTSGRSFRGPGLEAGLRVLERVRSELSVPTLTDVHEATPLHEVADVVDVLQTPAFLVRQTAFIQRVARAGRPMNIKKGQFQAPGDMAHVVEKCRQVGNDAVMLCERGSCFGYGDLVVDMRGLALMRSAGCPVLFDATHSVQRPGGRGAASGGDRGLVPVLARAAVAVGVAGLFIETHPDPDHAPCDGPNMWPLGRMEELLLPLLELDRVTKSRPFCEATELEVAP